MRKIEVVANSREQCYKIIGQAAGIPKYRAKQFCKVTKKGKTLNTIEGVINDTKYVATYPKAHPQMKSSNISRTSWAKEI